MALSPRSRLGPYEIQDPLGSGGMGEVYRARDTRLDRIVAIKILSRDLSASAEARRRFEREAKALSEVSHPHICAVYDVGMEGETRYVVMEYLEGETLASRLAKGALPLSETLRIGGQVADALATIHRRGIVHRDLKPSNVMLTASGAKLLDFGLARVTSAPAASPATDTLTTPSNLTREGAIAGTVPYMAPEQLEGKEADARTDIFALGAVLHEMATGKRAFNGASQASLISAILREDPPSIATLQSACPRMLDRAVSTCLAKSPEARWQSASDVAHVLESIEEGVALPTAGPAARARRVKERILWGAVAVSTLATIALLVLLFARPTSAPAPAFVSEILPPQDQRFDFDHGPPAVSPDGRLVAFVARAEEGGPGRIWIRAFDEASASPIAGTEGGYAPFWSPDSRSLAFFADGKLQRVDLGGGAPRTLCDARFGAGGTWNREGVIVFVPDIGGPIHRVAATGGTSTPVTEHDPNVSFGQFRPVFLPDGRRFLYLVLGGGPADNGVFLGSLDSKEERVQVVPSRANVSFVRSAPGSSAGMLFFLKNRTLMAQAFDSEQRRLGPDAVLIAEQIKFNPINGVAAFSVSDNGVLAYQTSPGGKLSRLVWLDREGKRLDEVVSGAVFHPRLSHDGRRVAYALEDPQTSLDDIWIHDLSRRISTRLTFGPEVNIQPVWSPDDRSIFFSSNRNGRHEIFRRDASGAGDDERILGGTRSSFAMDYSQAAGLIALQSWDVGDKPSAIDLQVFSPGDREATTVLSTPYKELFPQFAPDGVWLAYCSNESGRDEVYLRPTQGSGAKLQVSTAGGAFPRWRGDGSELFFIAPDGTLTVVDVATASEPRVGLPRPLFRAGFKIVDIGYPYDVSADGKRFLVNELVGDERAAPLTVVQNWMARVK